MLTGPSFSVEARLRGPRAPLGLTKPDMSSYRAAMATVKISSKVDEEAWAELRSMAEESHQSVSGLLTEAIREYIQRRRVRPVVLEHLRESIEENRRLGELLAR
jgi:predicted transcriptional regulator